jgi:hypothetical protein
MPRHLRKCWNYDITANISTTSNADSYVRVARYIKMKNDLMRPPPGVTRKKVVKASLYEMGKMVILLPAEMASASSSHLFT